MAREQSKRDSSNCAARLVQQERREKRPRCSGRNDRSGWVAGVLLGIEMAAFWWPGDVSKSRSLLPSVERNSRERDLG